MLISLLSTELLSIRNQLTFIGHFPHAKLCSKCFSSIISVNPHSNLMKWEQLTQLKPIAICSLLDIFLFYKLPCTFISFCPDSVILPFSGNCSLPAQWLSLPQSSNILKVLKNLSPDHCFFGFPLSLFLITLKLLKSTYWCWFLTTHWPLSLQFSLCLPLLTNTAFRDY